MAAAVISTGTLSAAEAENKVTPEKKSLKVLTIGNSFSNSVFVFLPKMVKSTDTCEILMERAAIGGCSLKKHWDLVEQSEKDPDFKPYDDYTNRRKNVYSLKDLLQKHKYDIVTIQQASHDSWKKETYFPYAQNLCDYVRKYCPGAKIMMQQTWSYRADDPRLEEWKITPDEMYQKLRSAYAEAAEKLGIELIPTGDAIDYARKNQKHKFVPIEWRKYMDLKYPDPLPDQTGSLINGFFYRGKDKKLMHDAFHLNKRGEYLQACVWFVTLFDRPCSDIKMKTTLLDKDDAAFMREVADKIAGKKDK